MKKLIVILLGLFFGSGSAEGQEPVDIYGYYETQVMGARIQQDFNHVYSNKIRVDFQSDFSESVSFRANFDYITYHGKTQWDILDFMSDDIRDPVPEAMRPLYVIPFSNQNFLDNAYVKVAFEHWDLTAGKQQISTGTGYVWNPMDVFNIKDVLDPTYEQPGHNAIRVDVPVGLRYNVTGLYSPEDTWGNSAKLLRFKGRLGHFDYSIIGIKTLWRFHDYTQFIPEQGGFLVMPETRRLLGASTAGEVLGVGVWAEYARNFMEQTSDFTEMVAGLNYTFDFQTFVMLEYYRNTLGKTDFLDYTLNDWMRLFATEQKAITRDQVYFLVQHPVSDFAQVGLSNIYSISDRSIAVVPMLTYSFSQNMEITAYVNMNFGREGTAYSALQGNGGLLRARIYF